MRLLSPALSIAILSLTVSAEVYQWTDERGRKHYSDRPRMGAEALAIHPGYAYHRVKRVYDGDTLLLENGQKVRFLGINTPEVESRRKLAEPGGVEAKQWLQTRLKGKKIRLQTDVEKQDNYGRLLAYVFTEDGAHLNLELVGRGLATVNIHPPNLRYSQQLLAQQAQAEAAGVGIWSDPHYAPQPFQNITESRGWKRVIGQVQRIKQTRKYVYLSFSGEFSLRIKKADAGLFPDWNSYRGSRVEARGWLQIPGKGYVLPVRHPGAIKILGR